MGFVVFRAYYFTDVREKDCYAKFTDISKLLFRFVFFFRNLMKKEVKRDQ